MSRLRFTAVLLVLVTLMAYLPVIRNGFSCYDDDVYVTDNPIVKNGLTWAGAKWAFTTMYAANWHPLTWLSHMLDCGLFGLNAGALHGVNVLFHTANAVLLLLLLFRLTGALWPSAVMAALFAWHPLHVESVAWISERKDVLSTFFELLALLAYAGYAQRRSRIENRKTRTVTTALDARRATLDYVLAVLFFALGLMAKPMLVTLPIVLLLLDYWPLKRFSSERAQASRPHNLKAELSSFPRLIMEKWPFFLLAAAACVVTLLAQNSGGAIMPLANVPLHFRLENIPVAYALYLLKTIWPAHLAVFYPLHSLASPIVAVTTTVLLAISGLVYRVRRQYPYALVGWLWFLGTLVPVIGLVKVGSAVMADRYTYFPAGGVFLLIAFGLHDVAKRFHLSNPLMAGLSSLALLACLALTENQLRYWRNDIALFSHAIAVTRDNDVAYINLGYALEKEGQKAKAMAAFRESIQIAPQGAEPHNDLANLLADAGRSNEALAEYRIALRINPHYVMAHENLGILLARSDEFDKAIDQFAIAARLDPGGWYACYLMGEALLKRGRDAEAVARFQQALKKDPNNLQTLSALAQVLSSDEDPKIRDGQAAFVLASKADALADGIQPATLDLLAMAYAELGRFDDAVKVEQNALEAAKASRMTNDLATIQERLQLYQKHQPLRQSFASPASKQQLNK